MTKRSVALVGVLILMVMIGSSVIGAFVVFATSDADNGNFSVYLPLILNAIGAMAEVPQGAVMTFNLPSCPSGWTEVTAAQGKAIVGLPSGGTLLGTVGSGLGDLEDRSHNHEVNPTSFASATSGYHSHEVDPPLISTSSAGSHSHSIDPPLQNTTTYDHNHRWAYMNIDKEWWTWYGDDSQINLVNWGDGMDSAGTGYYPIATTSDQAGVWTDSDSHNHSFNIPTFASSITGSHQHDVDINQFTSMSGGIHSHTVDVPNTLSTTASTSDVIPYIQFLVCEKD